MTWEGWFTLLVVVAVVAVMVWDVAPPMVAILGGDVALLLAGVITTEQAFAGFSNPAPITVAALFVVAAAVEKTGALQPLIAAILGNGDGGRPRLLRLLAPTAAASAFLNNTPIVAMLTPQVSDWASKRGLSASRYLMPISFATILGGVLTLIGTSTNLVVSGLMQAYGLEPMGMFEITRIGLPVAVTGITLLVLLSPILLPERRPARVQFEEESREYVVHQVVAPGGPLDGQTVESAGLRHLQGVFLVEIERAGETIAPATPNTLLRGGDRLAFVGQVDLIRDLQMIRGLIPAEQHHAAWLDGSDHTFFEVVISGTSRLVGSTLKESNFRSRYQAAVLAMHRAGERVQAKLGEVVLRAGDTLLLVADSGFADRWRNRSDFLLVSHLGGSPPPSTRQAWFVGIVTAGIVALSGLGLVPIVHAAILGAITLVVGKALSLPEARRAIDMDTLVVIAASFGIGSALENSGVAALLGSSIVETFQSAGALVVLLGVVLSTIALTELITNNAAAVLMFPIAMAAARQIDADPRPFAIALAAAASASFLTPIGYQTNTMVYGPGGYRFGDYFRLGFPLTLTVILTIALFVPLFWSF
ncbi:MAG TPA: SLC13 family permease [Longimicrobiaceae bacterium]